MVPTCGRLSAYRVKASTDGVSVRPRVMFCAVETLDEVYSDGFGVGIGVIVCVIICSWMSDNFAVRIMTGQSSALDRVLLIQ